MSERVRQMERAWLDSGGGPKRVPGVVRATWFLSSVYVNWRRLYSKKIRAATGEDGTPEQVREVLVLLISLGRTAKVLLEDLSASPAEAVGE